MSNNSNEGSSDSNIRLFNPHVVERMQINEAFEKKITDTLASIHIADGPEEDTAYICDELPLPKFDLFLNIESTKDSPSCVRVLLIRLEDAIIESKKHRDTTHYFTLKKIQEYIHNIFDGSILIHAMQYEGVCKYLLELLSSINDYVTKHRPHYVIMNLEGVRIKLFSHIMDAKREYIN
jgi:hypothetical protein